MTVYVTPPHPSKIFEYAHGGSAPIATLNDYYHPGGCSVDPRTGNLAVANIASASRGGNLAIYHHARGAPALWAIGSFYFYLFPGYDNHSNLFVDGVTEGNAFEFAELPNGGTLVNVSLNQTVEYPGNVQWDGTYLTVADDKAHVIYQFTIAGSAGTLQGTTSLTGWSTPRDYETWIQGTTVVAPYGEDAVGLWNYPAGGTPTSILKASFTGEPQSMAVSLAPH